MQKSLDRGDEHHRQHRRAGLADHRRARDHTAERGAMDRGDRNAPQRGPAPHRASNPRVEGPPAAPRNEHRSDRDRVSVLRADTHSRRQHRQHDGRQPERSTGPQLGGHRRDMPHGNRYRRTRVARAKARPRTPYPSHSVNAENEIQRTGGVKKTRANAPEGEQTSQEAGEEIRS